MKPSRMIHVITGLGVGGAEMMLLRLLAEMDQTRYAPAVISLTSDGALGDKMRALGIPVTALGMQPGSSNPLALLGGVRRLAAIFRRHKPELVQTWMYHADLIGGLAARLAGSVPVVWNVRSNLPALERNKRATVLTARLCAVLSHLLPRLIITNSRVVCAAHIRAGYSAKKMRVIPNGFDLSRFQPNLQARAAARGELGVDDRALLVGMVARFDRSKGHQVFIEAAGRLAAVEPRAVFVLCGEGATPENATLMNWISTAQISERIHLLGRRDDIPRWLNALDLYVSASISEAFPNVVGEAMACELPCVVTDVGDSAGIVADTGWVVPPRDPAALAAACASALALSPEERAAMGKHARQRVYLHFDLPKIVAQYMALYDGVLAQKP